MAWEDLRGYISPVLKRQTELVIERGAGSYLYDVNGKKYLDFVQGIATNPLGHCHPDIVRAVQEQCASVLGASFSYFDLKPTLLLAEKLSNILPGNLDSVLFSCSGGEANEGAIKLAKFYTRRQGIIAFLGAYHGKNYGALAATTVSADARSGCGALPSDVYITPYPAADQCPEGYDEAEQTAYCLAELEKVFDYLITPEHVAAIIMEPILGDGGYYVPPVAFVQEIRRICSRYGILLIFDEVQTGYGRSGKMFACEHFGVAPDVMTLGKPMASGLPLSALAANKSLMKDWSPGRHGGGTFGGNPVCCAAANALLALYEKEPVLTNCCAQGKYFMDRLLLLQKKYHCIFAVRGLGLMVGMELVNQNGQRSAAFLEKVRRRCIKNGLVTAICGLKSNVMRFIPPLNISRGEIDECISILDQSIADVLAEG